MEAMGPDLTRREQDWTESTAALAKLQCYTSPLWASAETCELDPSFLRSISFHLQLNDQDASEMHILGPQLSYQSPGAGA